MPRPSSSNAPARYSIATRAPAARHMIFAAAGLALLVLAAYAPLWEAGFIWDDDHYVTENPCLRSLDGLREIWCQLGAVPQYYPLVHTTFWIEHHLWGLDPHGYHAINVVPEANLRCFAVAIADAIAERLPAAAIFVHPIEVESVAWITGAARMFFRWCWLSSLLWLSALHADRSIRTSPLSPGLVFAGRAVLRGCYVQQNRCRDVARRDLGDLLVEARPADAA